MERNYSISVATCPVCKSVCLLGHDDDGQISCAKCGKTFRPEKTKEMNDQEYRAFVKTTTHRYDRAGWTAFSVNNSI